MELNRALLSVSDKRGIEELAKALYKNKVEIISTGGTAKRLEAAKIPYTPIEEITQMPEAFGGRMKTISFQIEGGILFRRDNPQDVADSRRLNIPGIDLVVVNLYPFEQVYASGATEQELVENIDIGGPCMMRAAAKNFADVCVLPDPDFYGEFLQNLEESKEIPLEFRKKTSLAAFQKSAKYEACIVEAFSQNVHELRYGENPHQSAKLIVEQENTLASAKSLQGKELSYNNFLDADAAFRICNDLHFWQSDKKVAIVVKHANPCGVAVGENQSEVLDAAWQGDPVSAFGSVLCFNTEVEEETARYFDKKFVEVILAPTFSAKAKEYFATKKNLRLLEVAPQRLNAKQKVSIHGGFLEQDLDQEDHFEFQAVTETPFPKEKLPLAEFAKLCAKHLKSNAIALVREQNSVYQLLGAGMGQPNRIDCIRRLAIPRMQEYFKDIDISKVVLASDAFFPFADSIEQCREYGLRYIVQPGGSVRDDEVIDACNQNQMAMLFTGKRNFKH